MSVHDPSPEVAKSALTEVQARRTAVRASDRLYQPALIVLAGTWVALITLIALMSAVRIPPWMGPIEGYAVAGLLAVGLAAYLSLVGHVRAHSRAGNVIFRTSLATWGFMIWGIPALGFRAGWLGPEDLLRGAHIVLVGIISVTPLLLGALLLGRRR